MVMFLEHLYNCSVARLQQRGKQLKKRLNWQKNRKVEKGRGGEVSPVMIARQNNNEPEVCMLHDCAVCGKLKP